MRAVIRKSLHSEVDVKLLKATVVVALLGLVVAGASAFAADVPTGGTVKMFATPGAGAGGRVTFTGAVGDYGTLLSTDKSGTAHPDAGYLKITLQRGTFKINVTEFIRKLQRARASVNFATCSAALSATAPAPLYHGTGLYKGITGTLRITARLGIIGARLKSGPHKGQCDHSANAPPVHVYEAVIGSGRVTFS
jgi:hypothetical protein